MQENSQKYKEKENKMSENKIELTCWVLMYDELRKFRIIFRDGVFDGIWDNDNDYWDGVNGIIEFSDLVDDTFYEDKYDFPSKPQSIKEWIEENELKDWEEEE
jgi:hypothetical protein